MFSQTLPDCQHPPQNLAISSGCVLSDVEHFNSLVNQAFFPMSCERAPGHSDEFYGALQSRQVGSLGLVKVEGSPLDVYRRTNHIGRVGDAVYLVKVQTEGEGLICHRGQQAHLRPGDFTLCLSSEPYELHFAGRYSQVVLAIPELLMESVYQPNRFLGVRMNFQVGTNGVFSQFVASIANRLDDLSGVVTQRLETSIIDLLGVTLDDTRETQRKRLLNHGTKPEHLWRIKRFIRRNLNDERLGLDWIAGAHNISTRYLHMLFEGENMSVSRYIQRLRLEYCKNALTDQSFDDYSVAEIAYRSGFKDASHFNRIFKKEFEETPAHLRKNHQQNRKSG